jgi:hypothetical protein
MLYEQRIYEAMPGRMPDLHRRFQEHTLALFAKHDLRVVAFFTYDAGGPTDQVVYLLAFEDAAQRERAWAAFLADPDWQAAKAESERDGPLLARFHNTLLRPTAYSPEL